MVLFKRKTADQKEIKLLERKEAKLLKKRKEKKESGLNRLLAAKVPDKLQHTLDVGFEKAFNLIFAKGTGVIEKTYNKKAMENEFKINEYTNEVYGNRKSLKKFKKNANKAGNANIFLSGVSGIGMGLAGVGIPDIPVFTSMLLKNIYQIAIHYGFDYKTEEEKYIILLIIEGAVSYGEHFEEVNKKVDMFIESSEIPVDYEQKEQIKKTSGMLSKELLYMKFLQGIPIVGAVGGAYDIAYMKNISDYAKLKYQKRFLLKCIDKENKLNDGQKKKRHKNFLKKQ